MTNKKLPDEITLGEARDWLRDRVDDGAECPCCAQHAQVYRWNLYSTAARALIYYYRLGGTSEFVRSSRLKDKFDHTGQGDASRLKNWGLVEEEKTRRPDGGRSGFWRVTKKGGQFAEGEIAVPQYCYVYNNRVQRIEGSPITIQDALGTEFNHNKLMGRE